jgi:hypothetical protein
MPLVVVLDPHGAGNVGMGDVSIGLTPPLLISVAPSGMPLPDGAPVVLPAMVEVDVVPAALSDPHDPDGAVVAELSP